MFSVEQHTIFLALAGSQAHGTAHEQSDVDLRGVCVVPLSARLSLFSTFEQYEGPLLEKLYPVVIPRLLRRNTVGCVLDNKVECVIFDIAKFVRLCADANPNALEILFTEERDWILETPVWLQLYRERHRFLTKKVQQTFLGYAMAQIKKIKTHRAWLLNPPARKPTRQDFNLPPVGAMLNRDDQNRIEKSIADKLRSYSINNIDMPKSTRIAVQERMDDFFREVMSVSEDTVDDQMRLVASHALGLPQDVMAMLRAETKYRTAIHHWDSYQTWKSQRNRARAALEQEHGYDTKHAMHLIRLMRMGVEVLERGELLVRRPDAVELSSIRDGAMSFEEILAAAARLKADMETAAANTNLPDDIDRNEIDALVVHIMVDR